MPAQDAWRNTVASTFHPSLNRPKLVMGIGTDAFGVEIALGVIALNLQSLPLALVVAILHMVFRWVYRTDPIYVSAYLKYLKQADLYDPWVRAPVMQARPEGWGRGLHC